jgi:hypothetical protein
MLRMAPLVRWITCVGALLLLPPTVLAQNAPATSAAPSSSPPVQADEEDDAVLNPTEPDFVVINLPTTMRIPKLKGNFRLTHRFVGNLRAGTFSENASNLFGLDQGAIIGFEYRIGVMRHLQAAVFRTNFDKTIQMYGKYDALRQGTTTPIGASAIVSIEGTDNFQEKFAPAIGLSLSKSFGGRIAGYVVPMWVHNTAASLDAIAHEHEHGGETETHSEESHDHRSTAYVGLATRVRVLNSLYLTAEVTPRITGYRPDNAEFGFGLETRVGGHSFALTLTNTFGTTFSQLARGGAAETLYLGFNLGRKFY